MSWYKNAKREDAYNWNRFMIHEDHIEEIW